MTTLVRPKSLSLEAWKKAAHAHEAPADAMIRKYYAAQVKAEGEPNDRTVSFIVSTDTADRDGDDIAVQGWQLDNYRKNPVVLWAHDYGALPVGRSLETAAFNGALRSLDQFAPADVYPFADTVYQLILGGYLNACSVGFLPKKWEEVDPTQWWGPIHFLEQEMLEHSIVPVPANPEALVDAKAQGIDTEPIMEWAERLLSSGEGRLDKTMTALAEKAWATLETKRTTGTGNVSRETKDPELETTDDETGGMLDGLQAVIDRAAAAVEVQKSGRVMSQANLDKMHTALQQLATVHTGVCDMGDECPMKAFHAPAAKAIEDDEDEDAGDGEVFFDTDAALDDEDDDADDEDDEGFEVDEDALAAALGAAVGNALMAVTGRLPD